MSKQYLENTILYLLSFLPLALIVGSAVSTTFIILISIIFLISSLITKDWSWLKDKYIKLLFIFYFYLIFNSLISIEPSLGLARNLGFIRYIIFAAAIKYLLSNSKNSNFFSIIWISTITIVCIDVYYEFIFKKNLLGFGIDGNRIVSFFKDEPVVGGYLNAFMLIIAGFFFQKERFIFKKNNFLKILIPLALIIAITLTGERSNTIKALIGLSLFIFFINNFSFKEKFLGFFILTFLTILLIFSNEYLKSRFYGDLLNKINSKEKIELFVKSNIYFSHYRAGYEMYKKNPLFGVGNKNFGKSCNLDPEIKLKNGSCSTHPHQILFELLSEHGILGTFIIIGIIFYIIFSNIKNYIKFKNQIHLGTIIFTILSFLPILPTGAFFGNFTSTLFWINFSIMLAYERSENGGHDKN